MSKEDVKRYLEYEVPAIGMVDNDVSEVVCLRDDCEERVEVDPASLVVEDDDAVDVVSELFDHESGQATGRKQVEIYCSPECRNGQYLQEEP